jgi:hypothetical protein
MIYLMINPSDCSIVMGTSGIRLPSSSLFSSASLYKFELKLQLKNTPFIKESTVFA